MSGPEISGPERVFVVDLLALSPFYDRYLVEALQARIPQVQLWATAFPYERDYWSSTAVARAPGLLDRVAQLGIRTKRLRRAGQTVEYTANCMRLLAEVRRTRPEVVHIQWLPFLGLSALELRLVERIRGCGTAVVYTAHNALPHDTGERHVARYRRAYELMDALVVHTQTERRRLIDRLGVDARRIHVVPHGLMFHELPKADRTAARARLRVEGREVILFMGILRPYKGIEDLLRGIVHVLELRPDAHLLLAGQGDARYVGRLRALAAELGIERSVSFETHYIPVADIPALYAAADVVALPYRSASQSGALYTAATFDAPVVATAVGGLAETIHGPELGSLVPADDPAALAGAIIQVLERPLAQRRNMARALRASIEASSSWDRIAELTVTAYRAAIAQSR